ncbi:putative Acyl transferase/acyl hydrolase/lysophospholipase [Vibrio tapetis subsp. tapetis]|uniref:Putative Acyl transferase/acyl hydrolase/lysophospholipase n=1 Tax=Vibrio tapetis subsp. tapetis TaxID=1671868 RepID=A0A2N8ZB35_9VIBR|nr:putative Acyl transferase/acyl hydrolase/lysophospholipase [Vibrio tapetis subsp. tapetis]
MSIILNSGGVSEHSSSLDEIRLLNYINGKTALVAQGGGQRSIFTAGVIDSFLYANFDPFHSFYGTSAGAMNLCAFLSRQAGLGRSFLLDLTSQPEFFSLFGYIRHKQPLGLNWALNKIRQYPYRLDVDMAQRVLNGREAFASVTDTKHLKDHYLPFLSEQWFEVLTATCAIPRLYNGEVTINGIGYVDGGISAAIPIQEAWRNDARLIVAIRTESVDEDLVTVNTVPPTMHKSSDSAMPIWLKESVGAIQQQWDMRVQDWKNDWDGFLKTQFDKSTSKQDKASRLKLLNGGRWLFGAGDVYRLSHMLGEQFDAGLADLLMVHYQTYALTQDFLKHPPEDCFIVQIAPDQPLRSAALMSSEEDMIADYQIGLRAGQRFIETYTKVKRASDR